MAAKSPNIGSDPASPPPPNISTNEIPRYTQLLLTQRSAPLTQNCFFLDVKQILNIRDMLGFGYIDAWYISMKL